MSISLQKQQTSSPYNLATKKAGGKQLPMTPAKSPTSPGKKQSQLKLNFSSHLASFINDQT